MSKFNPKNERIKRQYFTFLKEAKRQSEASVDGVAKAISRFEQYTKMRDFKAFHFEQAIGFKKHLAGCTSQQTGKPLSKATMKSTTAALKAFFQWLSMQSGYKSTVSYSDAEYFNLSEKDTRIASAKRNRAVPTVEQIKHALKCMPATTVVEKRNRALVAFVLLTGTRDRALVSLKLKHINMTDRSVFFDAREVATKASKTFTTYFFPVGDEIVSILEDWVDYLRTELLFCEDDPLFPKTLVSPGASQSFEAVGVVPEHWSNAAPVRKIFRQAFEAAGLPYFNPHTVRSTLAQLGERLCKRPVEFKAWSQNLGHEGVLTTLYSYGEVQQAEQAKIIGSICDSSAEAIDDAAFELIADLQAFIKSRVA